MRRSIRRTPPIRLFVTSLLVAACSGGGGDAGPQLPTSVPDGSGTVSIQMAGTWQTVGVSLVEANGSTLQPPGDGVQFVLGPTRLLSIGGLSVAQSDLETLLGAPAESYVNEANGRTILYGVVVDRRTGGGTREQAAVAGGAIDANTIAIEGYSSTQGSAQAAAEYVLWRATLSRVSPSLLVPESAVAPDATTQAATSLHSLLGGR